MTYEDALKRYLDPYTRLNELYKIKTKRGTLDTFTFNDMQEEHFGGETTRDLDLKARQLGLTTLKAIQKLDKAMTTPNINVAIVAHTKEKVRSHFEIIKLAFDMLSDQVKPKVEFDNRYELTFPNLRSKIYVSLDTRGETVHDLHISELAYMKDANTRLLGILESVPPDGCISIESTANGMSGEFYEMWNDPRSKFNKRFWPWFWDKDYRIATNKTIEELWQSYLPIANSYGLIKDIQQRFNLTPEQFAWYIEKAASLRESIAQEYPSTDIEAFISANRNVFDMQAILKQRPQAPVDRKWNCVIWEQPTPSMRYSIGCDPSEGIGKDRAVIEVINTFTGNQAAEFISDRCPPDELAGYLIEIGKHFNKGIIVLEINNHGLGVMDRIKTKYANIYRREVFDKVSRQTKRVLGWKTTSTTKPLLIDTYDEALREETVTLNSETAVKELKTFVRTDEAGKKGYGAEGSHHDDTVIAVGLALQGMRQMPKKVNAKTEFDKTLESWKRDKALSQLPAPKIPPDKALDFNERKKRYPLAKAA